VDHKLVSTIRQTSCLKEEEGDHSFHLELFHYQNFILLHNDPRGIMLFKNE
jgi:hypothetical protein